MKLQLGSHLGFPANLRKKFGKTQKKFCIVTNVFFKGFRNKICYNQIKFTIKKVDFLFKLPLKNPTVVKKYFQAPFLPLMATIRGPTATKIPRPIGIFSGPFRVILQNCILKHNFYPKIDSGNSGRVSPEAAVLVRQNVTLPA